MRVLHTGDWHLGHTFYGLEREAEHRAFLSWLVDVIDAQRIDAVLIAGDIFETGMPNAKAQRCWYEFLANARVRCPAVDIVAVAGNHDSAARLEAPAEILKTLNVRVIGTVPDKGDVDASLREIVVPLHDRFGEVQAHVIALPFLRLSDLGLAFLDCVPAKTRRERGLDYTLTQVTKHAFESSVRVGNACRSKGQALLMMAHGSVVGCKTSLDSERPLIGGDDSAWRSSWFSKDIAYTALGHLHLSQTVGGRDSIRYSGSPIPLSFSERNYEHKVHVVDLKGDALGSVESIAVPRSVQLVRIPDAGFGSLETVLSLCEQLPDRLAVHAIEETSERSDMPVADRASIDETYLSVSVHLETPEPELRKKVLETLKSKVVRLVHLRVEYGGKAVPLAEKYSTSTLDTLVPEEVFRACYAQHFSDDVPSPLLDRFKVICDDMLPTDGTS